MPIGVSAYHFKGNFNGNGYSVNGINTNNASTSDQGLFGYASSATIQNLALGSGSVTGAGNCGAIVGYTSGCVIKNCINMSVNVTSTGRSGYVGGIVGKSYSSTINYCFNYADIKRTINANVCYGYVGGIVGYTSGNTEYCMNYGDITSTITSNQPDVVNYAGGIAGYSNKVSYSGNLGIVSAGNSSYSQGSYAGGITGNASGDISYCFNRGNVTANAKEVSSTTNITVPTSDKSLWSNTTTTQTGRLNNFDTNTFKSRIEYKTKSAYAGGIVGYSVYNVSNSYNTGTITGGLKKATLHYYYSYAYGVAHGGNTAAGMVPDTTGIVVRTKLEYIDKYYYAGINGNTDESTSQAYSVTPTYDTAFKMTVEDSKTYHRGNPTYDENLGNAQTKTSTGDYTFGYYDFNGRIKISNGLRTNIDLNTNSISISITYKWTDGKDDGGERSKDLYSLSWNNSKDNYTSKTSSGLKSLSSMALSNSVWATNSLINDGYPYIKALYWKDNSSSF